MIYVVDNFLDTASADMLLSHFTKHCHKASSYENTFTLDVNNKNIKLIDFCISEVTKICNDLEDNKVICSLAQIVKWPEGSNKLDHVDPSDDVFAAVIFLNDDFDGGETAFETGEIQPSKGECLIFKNGQLKHSVKTVKNGHRYTLSMWFKKDT